MRLIACLSLLALALPAAASALALDIVGTIREAGMIGYWAQNCRRPPGLDNWWKSFQPQGRGGVRSIDLNGEEPIVTDFTSARRIDRRDTAVSMIYQSDNAALDVVYRVENDVFFTWWSREVATGEVYVDGGLLAGGAPIMRLNRCPGPPGSI